ncbi:MAG: DegV family protein [Peptococcaceae bacterium]|nr:DegV family protein [Peptococcaceae bacterium]
MKWNIIADSSCDIYEINTASDEVAFHTIPFTITVDGKDYVDHETLDKEELVTAMETCKDASHTSCPSPYAWFEQFEKADYAIAVTISSQLSGSYNSAVAGREMALEKYPDKKIAIIDSRSAGPELIFIVEHLLHAIEKGLDFEDVVAAAKQLQQHTYVTFALCSFHNLIKNGRMSRLTGFLAGKLGFWGIGIGSAEGTIQIKGKARSRKKAINAIIDDLRERAGSVKTVLISHCQNHECAEMLRDAIRDNWSNAEVKIMPTRGLCSYYAEKGGLIVGFKDNK